MKIHRRYIRALSLSVVAVTVLVACGGDDDSDSASASESTTQAESSSGANESSAAETTESPATTPESPATTAGSPGSESSSTQSTIESSSEAPATNIEPGTVGGTLVSLIGNEPPHFNPAITTDIAVSTVGNTIYEGLFTVTREREIEPKLATGYELSADGLVYTLSIQEGVTWQDGEPFTSADVAFNFTDVLKLHPAGQGVASRIAAVDTPDDTTVVVTLSEPYAPFITSLARNTMPLLAKHLYEGSDIATNDFNLNPVGTGPFIFEEYQPGQQVSVVRNENYWGPEKPRLDRIVFTISPDTDARFLALTAGDIDHLMSAFIDTARVSELEEIEGLQLDGTLNNPQTFLMFFNNDRAPLDNPEVRKALMMGIDRELIAQSIFPGDYFGEPAHSSIPRRLAWASNPDVDYMTMFPYDPQAAQAALEAAGVSDLAIDLTYRSDIPGAEAMVQIIASNLGDIGVDVNLILQETALWTDETFKTGNFDLTVVNYTTYSEPVLGIDRTYRCEDDPEAVFTNASGYCNPELDALFDEAARALTREERVPIYHETQEIIAADLPTAVIVEQKPVDAIYSNRIGNADEFFRTGDWEVLFVR
jgi:peptide/nickel transport system substrate-binding protein